MSEELVDFFKAFADANRLKIVGLLARQPYSVEELAVLLDLKASTVSHHLAKLAQIGLVSAKADSYYNIYHRRI
jgi:DNA-binding transcriptional ArsR family regulator